MAAFDTTRPVRSGTRDAGRPTSIFTALVARIASWNDARATRKALSRLSDRELDDIGLCRADIESVIRNGA
jgi:uncharacterized protein YjiS (DUF1127 family)